MPGRVEFPRLLVYAENMDVIGGLVGRQQEVAGGVDAEATGRLATGRLVFHVSQFPRLLVDRVDHDGVVSAIGTVNKTP